MSRSRKKNPFCGNSTAPSDKADKQHANRLIRHQVKQDLNQGKEVLTRRREVSEVYSFAKDGKQRCINNPSILRK